jgi:hypothetical protein
MCFRRAPEKYIAGAALDRTGLKDLLSYVIISYQYLRPDAKNYSHSSNSEVVYILGNKKKTSWPESANELRQSGDCRLSAKVVSTFAGRGCRVVSATNPYGRTVVFLDREFPYICRKIFTLQFAIWPTKGGYTDQCIAQVPCKIIVPQLK